MKNISKQMQGMTRNLYYAGLSVISVTANRARSSFDKLVEKGSVTKGQPSQDKESSLLFQMGSKVSSGFDKTLNRVGLPSGSEIKTLAQSVEQLNKKIETMDVPR